MTKLPGHDRMIHLSGPHAFIQWKGTDVCMDVYCECGEHSHFDGPFAYYIKCPTCGTVYACGDHVELVKLTTEEAKNTRPVMGFTEENNE